MPDKGKIVEEHFWITATTLAVNGFIISSEAVIPYAAAAKILSTAITLYAVFLIVHRSAAHADRLQKCYPSQLADLAETDKTFQHKAWETWCHLKVFPGHLLFVICEFSGAFFYVLLAVASCFGVWIRPQQRTATCLRAEVDFTTQAKQIAYQPRFCRHMRSAEHRLRTQDTPTSARYGSRRGASRIGGITITGRAQGPN